MRAIVLLLAVALILFLSGCTTTGDVVVIAQDKNVLNDYNGATFNDYNQVFGSPTYFAGSNILIGDDNYISVNDSNLLSGYLETADLNGLGDQRWALIGTGGGGSGTTYTGTSPISVNNDANTISLLGNYVNKIIQGTNITVSCTGGSNDGNCTINSTAAGGSGGRTYTGIAPIIVDNDANTIDWNGTSDIDGGFANSTYLVAQKIDGGGA